MKIQHWASGFSVDGHDFSKLATPATLAWRLLQSHYVMDGIIELRTPSRGGSASRSKALARLAVPKVLLCDLDGTLIDTMPLLADLATEVMTGTYGIPRVLARELYLATCGLPFIGQLEEIFPGDQRNREASARFEGSKPGRCDQAKMPVDTLAALHELRRLGTFIAVSSNNGRENVERFASNADFPFDLVMGYGNGLAKGRPHVQMVERVFGVGRGQMLFIGDSLHDGEIALTEGITFVGVAGTFAKESFALRFPSSPVVARFADVLHLMREESSLALAGT
ncbi:MAG: HAD hydrolase-like protein [Polyangia bacterium]